MNDGTHQPRDDGPEPDGRHFRTTVGGRLVVLPATIAGIRAALPEDRRDAFTKEIENTPARDMHLTLYRWARTPEIEAEDEAAHAWVRELYEAAERRLIEGESLADVQDQLQSDLRKGPGQPDPEPAPGS
ncbi:hypothetical protein [Embleya sp. MST-111070]|uniref:hypothetical protein n=1 Tax=Embleya sp. MST-111070 TaxID=3398231 RepID=UPI003F732CAE